VLVYQLVQIINNYLIVEPSSKYVVAINLLSSQLLNICYSTGNCATCNKEILIAACGKTANNITAPSPFFFSQSPDQEWCGAPTSP
jgi:hypothetical protein